MKFEPKFSLFCGAKVNLTPEASENLGKNGGKAAIEHEAYAKARQNDVE